MVTAERERKGAQTGAQGDQRRLTASTKGREQPPTPIVYEPAILAAHGVLLLDDTHNVSFQQGDIQVLGSIEIALCLEETLWGIAGQEGSTDVIRLQEVGRLQRNKAGMSGCAGPCKPWHRAEGTHQANEGLPPGRLPFHAFSFKCLLGSCLGLWEEGEGLELLEDSTVLILEDGNEVPFPARHLQQLEPEQSQDPG